MSRKRRELARQQQASKRRWARQAMAALGMFAVLFVVLHPWSRTVPESVPPMEVGSTDQPRETPAYTTYLELDELPADDEEAKRLIRDEYYHFRGVTLFNSESEIPLETLLVPDQVFNERELGILVSLIETIGSVQGGQDPAFIALKEWAEQKEGRLIKELLPLDKKIGIRNGDYVYAFDAFWSSQLQFLYLGRHQLPYFMLSVSTLYQEAYHAVQLKERKVKIEDNAEIEHEAHLAQLAFNDRMLATIKGSKSSRRFRLELEVINENLRDSIDAYNQGLINRTGIPLQSKERE